jgi:hypothetical protein
MPFIPAENTAQVRVNQTLFGEKITNTFYVQKNSEWGTADLQALANIFISWWNDDYSDNLSFNLGLTSVSARSMQAEDAPGVEIGAPALSIGLSVADSLPGNVALVVKHTTGLTGRNRRGRTYVAGIGENVNDGNVVTTVFRDAVVTTFGELRDRLIAAGYTHVVASFYDGTALVPLGDGQIVRRPVARATALLTPVEAYTADTQTDSQRKRLAGRGN